MVRKLARIQCTIAEISAVLGCSRDTLERRFRAQIEAGYEHGRATLRRKQWQQAMKGNTTMLIWLGKQVLEQADKAEVSQRNTIVEVVDEERTLNRDSDS
jgi:AraC-like DNA-binding protein